MNKISLAPLLFIVSIIFYSCETSPPEVLQSELFEIVNISANVEGAEIFINGESSGFYTPAALELIPGEYLITLEKESYLSQSKSIVLIYGSPQEVQFNLQTEIIKKIVLLEDFANTGCAPCVTSNKIIESLKNYSYNDQLVVVKYPASFPAPNDPFYLENTADCNARMMYYNVLFAPTTIIDGIKRPVSTDSNSVKNAIEERIPEVPSAKIIVETSLTGLVFDITVSVEISEPGSFDYSNYVLHTIITETEIEYNAPNGETVFYDVMRKMLPSSSGVNLSAYASNEKIELEYQYQLKNNWNSNKIHCIAFLQNTTDKEVIQSAIN